MITSDLSDAFFVRWLLACERLQVDPFDLISVAYSESGCSAKAHNPHGDASGLIQFMPATLKGLGWVHGDQAFRSMSAEDQVPYVEAYFRPWSFRLGVGGQHIPQLTTAAHCYVATFLPGLLASVVGALEGWRTVTLCARGGKLGWAYDANTVLDRDKDGRITPEDLATHLEIQCKGPRWEEICKRLQAARQGRALDVRPANDNAPVVIDGGTIPPPLPPWPRDDEPPPSAA
jgi:hypothetical protein